MAKVLEPCYNVPSRVHFSRSFVPALNKHAQAAVNELSTGQILHMEHYWRLCYLFFLFCFFLIDNMLVIASKCLDIYSKIYGQWGTVEKYMKNKISAF